MIADLAKQGVVLPSGNVRVSANGDSAELSAELLERILRGKKRAGTALLWAMNEDDDELPSAGDIEVVVDHRRVPVLLSALLASK